MTFKCLAKLWLCLPISRYSLIQSFVVIIVLILGIFLDKVVYVERALNYRDKSQVLIGNNNEYFQNTQPYYKCQSVLVCFAVEVFLLKKMNGKYSPSKTMITI